MHRRRGRRFRASTLQKRQPAAVCVICLIVWRGRDTTQEYVEGSPAQSRISPSIQRILRQTRSRLSTPGTLAEKALLSHDRRVYHEVRRVPVSRSFCVYLFEIEYSRPGTLAQEALLARDRRAYHEVLFRVPSLGFRV